MNDAPLKVAWKKVSAYCEESKLWKKDHALAMGYYNFQDFLRDLVGLFDTITKIDEDWRWQVLRHETPYEEAVAESIRKLYESWHEACAAPVGMLPLFESRFGRVENAEELLVRWREAQGILTPDEEFFTGDALAGLRDKATDEHRSGEAFDVGRSR